MPALRLLGISLWRSRRVHVLDDEQGRRGLDYVHEEPLLELRFNYIREKLVSSNTSNIGDKVVK